MTTTLRRAEVPLFGAGLNQLAFRRPALLAGGAWLAGIAVTAVVLLAHGPGFGWHDASMHVALDSIDGCVALLVALLLHGRFVREPTLGYLLLVQGFVLLAVASVGIGPVFGAALEQRSGRADVWLSVAIRCVGTVLVLAAAMMPRRAVTSRRRSWCPQLTVPLAIIAVIWVSLWAIRNRLPVAISDVTPDGRPALLAGHPLLLAAHAGSALCFLIASIAFTIRGAQRHDELLVWLGPACALAGFSRIHYLLFPSLYTDAVYTGDLLRTACYLVLIVGAVRELQQYWTARARTAVLDDRRRLARELHDSVVQELAFIRAESHAIPDALPSRSRILAASDRGLDEARAAIQMLGRPGDEPLGFMLHRAARELAERYGVELEVEVDDSITARSEQKHALLRIAREAVSNAVRHGDAQRLALSLGRAGDRQRLTIRDDGRGFDVNSIAVAPGGYGLASMRERARALPGLFDVSAELGSGTQVTVTW